MTSRCPVCGQPLPEVKESQWVNCSCGYESYVFTDRKHNKNKDRDRRRKDLKEDRWN